MRHAVYVSQLLPNSKFIFMIRDGRAVAASIVKRKVSSLTDVCTDPGMICLPVWTMRAICDLFITVIINRNPP